MIPRSSRLTEFDPQVVALPAEEARAEFHLALAFVSKTRYGLDETAFPAIERLDVDDPGVDAKRWLAERITDGDVLLAFEENEVFRVPVALFIDHWRDMMLPSRDDVVILPVGSGWVLLYSHEAEFEFARVATA